MFAVYNTVLTQEQSRDIKRTKKGVPDSEGKDTVTFGPFGFLLFPSSTHHQDSYKDDIWSEIFRSLEDSLFTLDSHDNSFTITRD